MADTNESTEGAPFENALQNYDNVVKEADKKKGFLDEIKNKVNSAASTEKAKKLNKLKNFTKNLGLDKLATKLGSYAKNMLNNAASMLKDMANDAVHQLKNAAISFASNIVADFIKNLQATMFISDENILKKVKTLYYAGADLAYGEHYLRKNALKNDWQLTLEFCDKEYGIHYNITYNKLESELSTCSRNSCWKNVYYIFGKLYECYKDAKGALNSIDYRLDTYYSTKEAQELDKVTYEGMLMEKKDIEKEIDKISRLFVQHFKNLVIGSYTYFDISACKKFFDSYPELLKPKYFGTNDDKFNGSYKFTSGDCRLMMPYYVPKASPGDQIAEIFNGGDSAIEKRYAGYNDNAIQTFTKDSFGYFNENASKGTYKEDLHNAHLQASTKITMLRMNQNNKQMERQKLLSKTAVKGSSAVYKESRARYPQNKDLVVVKYRKKNVGTFLKDTFDTSDKMIEPKNKNIKQIYMYLSNQAVFGNNRMINQDFYERCQLKTSNVMSTSVDKMKGIMGASYFVQNAFDLSDAIDSSAYKFVVKHEKYLFNPKTNVPKNQFANNYADFTNDLKDMGIFIEGTFDAEDILPENAGTGIVGNVGEDGKNPLSPYISSEDPPHEVVRKNSEYLQSELERNSNAKMQAMNIFRFLSEIPMVSKRDIIVRYLQFFMTEMTSSGVPLDERSKAFSTLVYNALGSSGHVDMDTIHLVFEDITDDILNNVLRNMVTVYLIGKVAGFTGITESDYKKAVGKEYNILANLLLREIKSIGFVKSIFNYDTNYLKSAVKHIYESQIEYMTNIKDLGHMFHDDFWSSKDNMTEHFTGFDRWGLFGWDEKLRYFKFTNYETADWNDVKITKDGTFIAGYEYTPSKGIKKLDSSQGKFVDTNYDYGNWKIYPFSKFTFFKDSVEGLTGYWSFSEVKLVFIDEFIDDMELVELPNSLITLQSKTNNGLWYFDPVNKKFIQADEFGGKFKKKQLKNGWLLYSDTVDSYAFLATSDKLIKLTPERHKIWSISELNGTVDMPLPSSGNSGSGSPSGTGSTGGAQQPTEPQSLNGGTYHVVLGGDMGIYHLFTWSGTGKYNTEMICETFDDYILPCGVQVKEENKKLYLFANPANDIDNTHIKELELELEYKKNGATAATNVQNFLNENDFKGKLIKNEKILETFTDKRKYEGFIQLNEGLVVKYSNGDIKFYSENNDGDNMTNVSGYTFDYALDNTVILGTKADDFAILDLETLTVASIFDDSDKVEGWEWKKVDTTWFLVNHKNEKGVRIFNTETKKVVGTGLTSGKWIVDHTSSKYFALSTEGCNSGIRVSNKTTTPLFVNLDDPVSKGDYGCSAYDKTTKRLYIGQKRNLTFLDPRTITYDIDGFLYPLDIYNIHKTAIAFLEEKSDTFMDMINKLFTDKRVFIGVDVKGGENQPVPAEKYTLEHVLTAINRVFEGPDTIIAHMITNSGLYMDMLTFAQAEAEFDIDSDYDKANLDALLLMMYSSGLSADNDGYVAYNYYDIVARYRAETRNMIIMNNTEFDGTEVTAKVGTSEWNRTKDFATDDFLDSDDYPYPKAVSVR